MSKQEHNSKPLSIDALQTKIKELQEQIEELQTQLEEERTTFTSFAEHHAATELDFDRTKAERDALYDESAKFQNLYIKYLTRTEAAKRRVHALKAKFEAYKIEHHDCVTKAMDESVAVHDEIEARRNGLEAEYKKIRAYLTECGMTTESTPLNYIKGLGHKAQALHAELVKAFVFLEREGYRQCDIPACNCGSWYKHSEKP